MTLNDSHKLTPKQKTLGKKYLFHIMNAIQGLVQ